MEFIHQINRDGQLTPQTGLTDITEKRIGLMRVSDCYRLMGLIAAEWNLNMSREKDCRIAYRMLIHFAKYN